MFVLLCDSLESLTHQHKTHSVFKVETPAINIIITGCVTILLMGLSAVKDIKPVFLWFNKVVCGLM